MTGPRQGEAPGSPDHLYLEITDRCNLGCKHCYLGAHPGGRHMMQGRAVRAALSDFAAMGGRTVSFSGGEPLLHPEWKSLLAHAARLGLGCTLITNGTMLDKEAIDASVRLGARIALSIDGSQAATHDAIRGRGNFARVQTALKNLGAIGAQGQVIVCFTPMRRNLNDLIPLAKALHRDGFHQLYVSLLEDRGRKRAHDRELSLDTGERVRLLTQLVLLLTDPSLAMHVDTGHLTYFFERLLGKPDGLGDPIEGTLRVAPTGQVYLSAYVDDEAFRLGSLQEANLRECFLSERVRVLYAQARERQDGLPACRDCPHWIVCGGGSPARAYANNGCLSTPDEFCEAKRIFLERWYRAV